MNFHHPFFPKHAFLFKSAFFSKPGMPGYDPIRNAVAGTAKGGGASGPAPQAPPAPPTASDAAVVQAGADAREQSLKKKGVNSTLLGDKGWGGAAGSPAGPAPTPGNTLLGGG